MDGIDRQRQELEAEAIAEQRSMRERLLRDVGCTGDIATLTWLPKWWASKVVIHCGPRELRYTLTQEGVLEVWMDDELPKAPADALYSRVEPGYTTWIMQEAPDGSA